MRHFAARKRNDERGLDRQRNGVDHRRATGAGRLTDDSRDGDIELAGAMIPLALLGAVVRVRRAMGSVKHNLFDHRIGGGRNNAGEGWGVGIVGHHDEVMARVKAKLVGPVDAASRDRVRQVLRKQVADLDCAVAIARPGLVMTDKRHAIRACSIVIPAIWSDEPSPKLGQYRIRGGVDDVDREIGAVAENIDTDDGIDEADVERLNFLAARHGDHGDGREGFIGAHWGRGREQRGRKSERKADQRSMIGHCRLPKFY